MTLSIRGVFRLRESTADTVPEDLRDAVIGLLETFTKIEQKLKAVQPYGRNWWLEAKNIVRRLTIAAHADSIDKLLTNSRGIPPHWGDPSDRELGWGDRIEKAPAAALADLYGPRTDQGHEKVPTPVTREDIEAVKRGLYGLALAKKNLKKTGGKLPPTLTARFKERARAEYPTKITFDQSRKILDAIKAELGQPKMSKQSILSMLNGTATMYDQTDSSGSQTYWMWK